MNNLSFKYFKAEVISYSNYYPFGMLMPNRHGQDDDYRYGFNGMEKDDEVRGTKGASYDFGDRMLDVRIGRWLSVDAKFYQYPSFSPYNFVMNSPLRFIDPDGNEVKYTPSVNGMNRVGGYAMEKDEGLTHALIKINKHLTVENQITFEQFVAYNLAHNPNADRIFKGVENPYDKNDPGYCHMNLNVGDELYIGNYLEDLEEDYYIGQGRDIKPMEYEEGGNSPLFESFLVRLNVSGSIGNAGFSGKAGLYSNSENTVGLTGSTSTKVGLIPSKPSAKATIDITFGQEKVKAGNNTTTKGSVDVTTSYGFVGATISYPSGNFTISFGPQTPGIKTNCSIITESSSNSEEIDLEGSNSPYN